MAKAWSCGKAVQKGQCDAKYAQAHTRTKTVLREHTLGVRTVMDHILLPSALVQRKKAATLPRALEQLQGKARKQR